MSFENFKDILDHARAFHRQLSSYYKKLGDKAERERVKMLLDYMSRHEAHLDESLKQYEEEVFKGLMKQHHYLGWLPKTGNTIWYVAIYHDQWQAIFFSAAALKCRARDQ